MVTVLTWGRSTTPTMTSVVVVNGAEEVRVPFLQLGGGMVALLLSTAEAHAAKGNVGDEESEEDNDGSSSSADGKR